MLPLALLFFEQHGGDKTRARCGYAVTAGFRR
jgi:hypothetical protein